MATDAISGKEIGPKRKRYSMIAMIIGGLLVAIHFIIDSFNLWDYSEWLAIIGGLMFIVGLSGYTGNFSGYN